MNRSLIYHCQSGPYIRFTNHQKEGVALLEAPCSQSQDRPLPARQSADRQEDAALVQQVLAGDNGVFEELMERYAPMVLGYLCGKMRFHHDREDLLQEIFVTAYCRLGTLRRLDRFGPWLMKIARNRLIDFQLKERRRPRMISLEHMANAIDGGSPDSRAVVSSGPVEKASAEQTQNLVRNAIGQMRDTYRTILYMRLIGEESPHEIARRLGLKESTVRMRLLRGLKKLRKIMQNQGVTPSEVS